MQPVPTGVTAKRELAFPRSSGRLLAAGPRQSAPAEPAPLDPTAAAEIDGDEHAPWLGPLASLAAEIGSEVTASRSPPAPTATTDPPRR